MGSTQESVGPGGASVRKREISNILLVLSDTESELAVIIC